MLFVKSVNTTLNYYCILLRDYFLKIIFVL